MPGPTLLLVEDNPTQQYVMKQLCERFEFDVYTVSSGSEAISALRCMKFAAVLIDLNLPDLSGIDLARQIRLEERKTGARIPLIAITGCDTKEDRIECKRVGMDDFLGKPFDPEDFRRLLLRWAYQPTSPNLKILRPYNRSEDASGR